MCLRFNDLDLCYWSQENSDTGYDIICNIHRSNEPYLLGIFRNGFETEPLLCQLMTELVLRFSLINVKVKVDALLYTVLNSAIDGGGWST
jgi:hypothetical protein